jgi:RNA polymerase sigma-70 factor, ECF subfamily
MKPTGSQISRLIAAARQEQPGAVDDLLAIYRNYLRLLARTWIDTAIKAKADGSDMVQETMMAAHASFDQFRGGTEQELVAWLRQILARNVAMLSRRYRAERRQAKREVSLDALLHSSSATLDSFVADEASSPSHAYQQRERAVVLADALAELSSDHREVIVLRSFQELEWDEVAEKMGRSRNAVRVLWARALKQLRNHIQDRL